VTGDALTAMDDAACARSAGRVNVFARMVPEQKLRLVRALQADGEVVGMTGDGVNDAPALRASDIGIAMGARGTDVAREAADLVVIDDDFTSITAGIRQGRGIFANLRKALTYIVAVHVPIFGMSLIPVMVADWPIVLMPVQVALLQFIIDPACSISFEAEPVDPKVMDEPPRALESSMFGRPELLLAIAQGLVVLAVVLGAYLWSLSAGYADDVVRSFTFVTLVSGNAALILVNRSRHVPVWETIVRRRNPTLLLFLSLGLGVITVLMVVPWFRDALGLGELTLGQWFLAVGLGLLAVVWFEVLKWIRRREPGASVPRHLR
jgi:Ca2+-transporting ATPase